LSLLNCRQLREIYYNGNPIENTHPLITRFLNRMHNMVQTVYNDTHSVHNHNIQESIRTSIINVFKYEITLSFEEINKQILTDEILTQKTKEILTEYCADTTEHSTLLITFKDLLCNVWQRIIKSEHGDEIKKILNIEMSDALCKCFTGRLSRLINVLNGFYDDIVVKIGTTEQIGNIIVQVKERLGSEYNVEKHKEIVIAELKERDYDNATINEWIAFI
jgi:hypothetical protein